MKSQTVDVGSLVNNYLKSEAMKSNYAIVVYYPSESAIRKEEIQGLVPNFKDDDNQCYVVSFDSKQEYLSAKNAALELIKKTQVSIEFYEEKKLKKVTL
jgi:hypothetical protein